MVDDDIIKGFKLAFLCDNLKYSSRFINTEYYVELHGNLLISQFQAEIKYIQPDILCSLINNLIEIGYFKSDSKIVTFSDIISIPKKIDKSFQFLVMNHIQKYIKTLLSYLSIFTDEYISCEIAKSLDQSPISINRAVMISKGVYKSSKPSYLSTVCYADEETFNNDINFILELLKTKKENIVKSLLPKGSKIKSSHKIKYSLENYSQVLPYENLAIIPEDKYKDLNAFASILNSNKISIKNKPAFREAAYYFNQSIYIIPSGPLTNILGLDNLANRKDEFAYQGSVLFKSYESFVNFKIINNNKFISKLEIQKGLEERYLNMYKDLNKYKNECISTFYGIFRDPSKIYAVFGRDDTSLLHEYFRGKVSKAHLKLLGKCIIKIIDFYKWALKNELSQYFTINSSRIKFSGENFKVIPSIEICKDFSQCPPEDLLLAISLSNRRYISTLGYLFEFQSYLEENLEDYKEIENISEFYYYLGEELKYQYSDSFMRKKLSSKNILKNFDSDFGNKISDKTKENEYFSIFKHLIDHVDKTKNIDIPSLKAGLKYDDENIESKKDTISIIYRSFLYYLFRKKLIKSTLDYFLNDLMTQDSKFASISIYSSQTFDSSIKSRSMQESFRYDAVQVKFEKIRDSHIEEINYYHEMTAQTMQKLEYFFLNKPLPSTANGEKIAKTYNIPNQELAHFSLNLLSPRVKSLLHSPYSERASNIYLLGRMIFGILFEQHNSELNKFLDARKSSLKKYLKATLMRRISYKISEDQIISNPKFANLCRQMMSYTPSQRPSEEIIIGLLSKK